MGCDGQVNNNCLVSGVFQSTHPSGVRHPCPSISRSTPSISIHAPQWGATELVSVRDGLAGISIHAPQWGATELVYGRDGLAGISIHAPQWGATQQFQHSLVADDISIHAPQWGATVLLTVPVTVWVFQSTHPSGVRPLSNVCAAPTTRFQSTHPSGVRHATLAAYQITLNISIHAPQWGATRRLSRARRSG